MDRALAETSRLAERQLRVQEQLQAGASPTRPRRAEQARHRGGGAEAAGADEAGGWQERAGVAPDRCGARGGPAADAAGPGSDFVGRAQHAGRRPSRPAARWTQLNAAAHQLLRARDDVSGSQSGSGLAEAMERMAQLAKQQGGLGQQGAGLLPMAGSGAHPESSCSGWLRGSGRWRRSWSSCGRQGDIPGAGADGRRGQGTGAAAGRRPAGPSGGGAAGAALPPDARRRPNASGHGKKTRRRSGRAQPPPTTASICRQPFGPGFRTRAIETPGADLG